MEGDLEHRAEDRGVREEAADGEKIKIRLDISPSSPQAKEYREKVEKELRDICNDVLVSNPQTEIYFTICILLLSGPVRQIPDCKSQQCRVEGVLPENEGGLLPLPGRGGRCRRQSRSVKSRFPPLCAFARCVCFPVFDAKNP